MKNADIKKMKVKTWYKAVILKSKKTEKELEREFQPDDEPRGNRSCIWMKYGSGEVVPRGGIRKDGRLNLVDRVEMRYKETAKWLRTPLWRLIDRAPMSMDELQAIYEQLPDDLRVMFIALQKGFDGLFWRQPIAIEKTLFYLKSRGGLDSLVAMLALVREAEIIQDREMHKIAVISCNGFLDQLFSDNELVVISGQGVAEYIKESWYGFKYFLI